MALTGLAATPLLPLSWEAKPLAIPSLQLASMEPAMSIKEQPWQLAVGPTILLANSRALAANSSNNLRPLSSSNQQSPQLGVLASLQLGSAWRLHLGYVQGWEKSSSRYRFQRTYSLNTEQNSSDGQAINSFEVEMDGKYAKTATEIEVSRTNLPTSFQSRLLIEASLLEEVTIRQLPMALTYDLPIKASWSVRLGAGVLWRQNQIQIEQQARLIQAGRFELRRSQIRSRELIAQESLWMGQVVAGLHFQPAAQWSFTAQVNLLTNLGPNKDTKRVDYQGPAAQLTAQYNFWKK